MSTSESLPGALEFEKIAEKFREAGYDLQAQLEQCAEQLEGKHRSADAELTRDTTELVKVAIDRLCEFQVSVLGFDFTYDFPVVENG